MVSAAADGAYQATLHTRYKYVAGGDPQTDFFQVYVGMNGATPAFLAFNFASAKPHASRIVLLANLVDHKFALKYYVPEQPAGTMTEQPTWAVATGVGGYDFGAGTPNPGHYSVVFHDWDTGDHSFCVNNGTTEIEADATPCTAAGVNATWGAGAIAAYLEVPAADATRAAPFLAPFETHAPLGAPDASTAEDLYWPASLE